MVLRFIQNTLRLHQIRLGYGGEERELTTGIVRLLAKQAPAGYMEKNPANNQTLALNKIYKKIAHRQLLSAGLVNTFFLIHWSADRGHQAFV
jgi:hypothetical protein